MEMPAKQRRPIRRRHFHAVRFYENAESLSRIVAEFVGEGLAAGGPALVIATPQHAGMFESQLSSRGFDVVGLKRTRDLSLVDADTMLRRFMCDGMPNPALFKEAAAPLLEHLSRGRTPATVRAYGEMVDVLWKSGETVAAVKLEMLWNELAHSHDFSLLCGYSMGNFYKRAAVQKICSHHTHVLSPTGELRAVN
jgi:hypothetical protein